MFELADLRICFIAGTLGQGGAERQLYYILKTLRQCGAKAQLLTLTKGEFWEAPIQALGVPVIWVGQTSERWRRVLQIIAELRCDRPAVIQSQHFYTNLYAALTARVLRAREICALRSNTVREVKGHCFPIGHLSLRAPRTIAANSRGAMRSAMRLGVPKERLHLLPNVVDTDYFRPVSPSPSRPVHIVAVSRLSPEKRIDRFLSLLAEVCRQALQPINVTVVGDGPLRPQLERQAADLGLTPGLVKFSGAVSDTRQVYQSADVLVLTSDFEGMPNVVLEAMSCGLAVVSTCVGGVPELVEDGKTGYLAAPGDEITMAKALLTLIGTPTLRAEIGARARAQVEARHSLNNLPHLLVSLYQKVLS